MHDDADADAAIPGKDGVDAQGTHTGPSLLPSGYHMPLSALAGVLACVGLWAYFTGRIPGLGGASGSREGSGGGARSGDLAGLVGSRTRGGGVDRN